MNIKVLSYMFIAALVLSVCTLGFVVKPSNFVRMELVDKMEIVSQDGQKVLYYVVSVSEYDSLLMRQYQTSMYHKEVSDSADAQTATQMVFFFYKNENLSDLDDMTLFKMSHGDIQRLPLLKKLGVDTNGYLGVRFSAFYRFIGRDSAYLDRGRVMVPRHGAQMKDFLTPSSSHK